MYFQRHPGGLSIYYKSVNTSLSHCAVLYCITVWKYNDNDNEMQC